MASEDFIIRIILDAQSKIAPVMNAVAAEVDKVDNRFKNLDRTAQALDKRMMQLENHVSKARDTFRSINPTLESFDRKMKSVNETTTKINRNFGVLERNSAKAAGALGALGGIVDRLERKLNQLDVKMTEMGARKYKPELDVQTSKSEAKVDALIAKLAAATRDRHTFHTDAEIGAAERKIESLRRQLHSLGAGDRGDRLILDIEAQLDDKRVRREAAQLFSELRAASREKFTIESLLDKKQFDRNLVELKRQLFDVAGIRVHPEVRLGMKEFEAQRLLVEEELVRLGMKREHIKIVLDVDREHGFREFLQGSNPYANEISNQLSGISETINQKTEVTFRGLINGAINLAIVFAGPLLSAITGVAGGLVAIVVAAGQAIAGLVGLASAVVAQVLPVFGLFALVATRVAAVIKVVQLAQTERDKGTQQGAATDKAAASALDGLRSAHEGVANAQRALTEAQKQLNEARRQGFRTLTDLALAEQRASLTAQQSKIAAAAAIASGDTGSLIGATQLQARSDSINANRARVDNQRAQAGGIDGLPAVQSATKGVADAERALAQARRAVDAAARNSDYASGKVGAAASNYLTALNKLSSGERVLLRSIERIKGIFTDTDGVVRRVSDRVIVSLSRAVDMLAKLLENPAVGQAFMRLAKTIGGSIELLAKLFTTGPMRQALIFFTNEATRNMAPLTRIFADLVVIFVAIARAASGPLRVALDAVAGFLDRIASKTSSQSGQSSLAKFFYDSLKPLEAFGNLIGSVFNLFVALAGPGGATEEGTRGINSLAKSINGAALYIRKHSTEVHKFFRDSINVLGTVGKVLVRIAGAMVKAFDPKSVYALGEFFSKVLIPIIFQFIHLLGLAVRPFLAIANSGVGSEMIKLVGLFGAFGFVVARLVVGPLFKLAAFIVGFPAKLLLLRQAFMVVGGALTRLPAIFMLVGRSFMAMMASMGPVGWIMLIVSALVTLYMTWGGFRKVVNSVISWIKDHWKTIGMFMLGPISLLVAGLIKFGPAILHWIKNAIGNVVDFVKSHWKEIIVGILLGPIALVVLGIKEFGPAILHWIKEAIKNVLEFVGNNWKTIIKFMLGPIGLAIVGVKKFGPAILHHIQNAIGDAIDFVKDHWKTIVGVLLGPLGLVLLGLKKFGPNILRAVKGAVSDLFDFFKRLPGRVLSILSDGIHNLGHTFEELGSRIIKAIVRGIKSAPKALWNAFKDLIPGPLKGAADAVVGTVGKGLHAIGLATGGRIGGDPSAGDSVHVRVTPGEVILNERQQREVGPSRINSALSGAPTVFASGSGYATGGGRSRVGGDRGNAIDKDASYVSALTELLSLTADDTEKIADQFTSMRSRIRKTLSGLNSDASDSWRDFYRTTARIFRKVSGVVYDAFKYIGTQTNKALSSFGERKLDIRLDPPVEAKASGGRVGVVRAAKGWVGQKGERGEDAVHALLGRGEAVLNWAHQKIVEPAMQATYGFGLDDMFKRTNALHAGAAPMAGGYAAGGGPDFDGHPSNINASLKRVLGAIQSKFPGMVVTSTTDHSYLTSSGNVSDHTAGNAMDISAGPELMNRVARWILGSGLTKRAKQLIYNGNPILAWNRGKDVGPGFFGPRVMAQHANHIHIAIAGAIGRLLDSEIKKLRVNGPAGALKSLAQAAIDKLRKVANDKLGSSGSGGSGDYRLDPNARVRGRVSVFGPPTEAAGNTASGLSSAEPGIALNINAGTDSGWNNSTTDAWVRARKLFKVIIRGHKALLRVIDKGPAGSTNRAIDVTGAGARKMGFNPMNFPTDAIGTATPAAFGGFMARGGSFLVNRPTAFVAGDNGPEVAHFVPLASGTPGRQSRPLPNPLGVFTGGLENISADFAPVNQLTGLTGKVYRSIVKLANRGAKAFGRLANVLDALTTDETSPFKMLDDAIEKRATLAARKTRDLAYSISPTGRPQRNDVSAAILGTRDVNALKGVRSGLTSEQRLNSQLLRSAEGGLGDINDKLADARKALKDTDTKKEKDKAKEQIKKYTAEQTKFKGVINRLLNQRADIADRLSQNAQEIVERNEQMQQEMVSEINAKFDAINAGIERQRRYNTAYGKGSEVDLINQTEAAARAQVKSLTQMLAYANQNGNKSLADSLAQQIADLNSTIDEIPTKRIQAQIDEITKSAERDINAADARQSLAQLGVTSQMVANGSVLGPGLGRANFNAIGAALQDKDAILRRERAQLAEQLVQAKAIGDQSHIDSLTKQMSDLDKSIVENSKAIQDNTQAAFMDALTRRQTNSNFFLGTNQIQTTILTALGMDPTASINQRSGLLGQLISGDKDSLLTLLNKVAPGLVNGGQLLAVSGSSTVPFFDSVYQKVVDSGLFTDDQMDTIRNLINGIDSNTQALLENTKSLNDTTQSFTSTAWQRFRIPIFDGAGALLPQYASQIPSFAGGGMKYGDGLALLHDAEVVLTGGQAAALRRKGGTTVEETHLHITSPVERFDPVWASRQIAFARRNK